MPEIRVQVLTTSEIRRHLDDLSLTLADCVAGGAGVSFMLPFTPSR
jgi:hypothetical protein